MDMGLIFPNWWIGFETWYRRRVVTSVNGYRLYGGETAGPRAGLVRFKAMTPCFPEKCHATETPAVPKPTQVGGYKNTKARERNLVKELGNIAP